MRLVVEDRLARRPAWWLLDEGRVVAWAGEVFPTMDAAVRAAGAAREGAGQLRYRIQQLPDDHWRWTAWRGGERRMVVGMGSHLTRELAREAARTAQLGLTRAVGP